MNQELFLYHIYILTCISLSLSLSLSFFLLFLFSLFPFLSPSRETASIQLTREFLMVIFLTMFSQLRQIYQESASNEATPLQMMMRWVTCRWYMCVTIVTSTMCMCCVVKIDFSCFPPLSLTLSLPPSFSLSPLPFSFSLSPSLSFSLSAVVRWCKAWRWINRRFVSSRFFFQFSF